MSADQAERHQLGFLLLPLQGAPPDNVSLSLHKKTLRLTDGCARLHRLLGLPKKQCLVCVFTAGHLAGRMIFMLKGNIRDC